MGDSHPETLVAITHLGAVLRAVNKLDAALPLAKEVRAGWKALEGDKGPVPRNTLTSTNILAELMHAMKLDREAEPLCREVLNGFLRAVGPNHPFTKSGAENLSAVLRALGKTVPRGPGNEPKEPFGPCGLCMLTSPGPMWPLHAHQP